MKHGDPSSAAKLEPLLDERAEELYEDAPCGYLSALLDGEMVKVNRTLLAWTGYARDELLGRRFQDLLTPGGRIYHETHYAPLLRMQGAVREIALELVCADGRRLPVLVNSVLRTDEDGQPLLARTTVFDATHRRGYERELLLAREGERAARQRMERLLRLSDVLAAAVDARQVADAAVAELAEGLGADQVTLALIDPESAQFRVIGHLGGAADDAWWERQAAASLGQYARAGAPLFWSTAHGGDPPPAIGGPVGGFEAVAVLPLVPSSELTGVLCLSFGTKRMIDDQERAFMQACAAQCGQALERARWYENERTVAHALQQSLLASEPPRDARFGVATCYLPAVASLDVGGDWHDTFKVGEETIGVVVGDVVGRGIEAASAMGQLRSATRALAGAEVGPARVLHLLDGFVGHLPGAHMATLAYAEVNLHSGHTRYACAGHPPPLVLAPEQPATLLWDGRSAPLGANRDQPPHEGRADLPPGSRLVLYTDGVVERRRASIDAGLARLVDEVQARRATSLGTLLGELVDALVIEDEPSDDVCLLCLEYRGS